MARPRAMRHPRQRRHALVPMTMCRLKRQALRLTQQRLAELAGVPQPYVSRVELMLPVHPVDLGAIARVLGLKPEELTEEVRV